MLGICEMHENIDDDEHYHPWNCICETCLQNHPEREILFEKSIDNSAKK